MQDPDESELEEIDFAIESASDRISELQYELNELRSHRIYLEQRLIDKGIEPSMPPL